MLYDVQHYINRINKFSRFYDMRIDKNDRDKDMVQFLKTHWICALNLFAFNLAIFLQLICFGEGFVLGKSLIELTFLLPCLTLCMLGNTKLYFIIQQMPIVIDLIESIKKLNEKIIPKNLEKTGNIGKWITFLSTNFTLTLGILIFGVVLFATGPMIIMAVFYFTTGNLKLLLPFIVWYPFDEYDIRYWPFVYIEQIHAAWIAIASVYTADSFYYMCCTYIQIHFLLLHHEMERVVKKGSLEHFKEEFVHLVKHHMALMRCINALELIFSKSTLLNVVTSSLIICAAGFNLMASNNLAVIVPFVPFLTYGLWQIFLFCYYGDYIWRSSLGVGDALYHSEWYILNPRLRKYVFITLIRSQRPCKLTAYGYTVINLRAFTKILSTSWSYFALLRQMYNK